MNTARKVTIALACLSACGLLAACASSTSSSSSSSSAVASAGSSAFAASRAKLQACLKQHGVTLPSRRQFKPGSGGGNGAPSGGGGAPSGGGPPPGGFGAGGSGAGFSGNPKLQAAFKACAAEFPRRGRGFAFNGAARRTEITKFVTCVRQHGYNLPKPNFSGKGPVFPSNIRTNPKFRTASQACAKLLVPRGAPGQRGAPPGPAQPNA